MTNFEALKAKVSYPVSDNTIELALTNRGIPTTGITNDDTYVVANRKAVNLAYADVLMELVSAPNVSEGGYSVSLADRNVLVNTANGVYAMYGESSKSGPKANFVQRW
jgi:hypothetical protein